MEPSRADRYERLAFTFCKAATIILLTGKYALPVAAGATVLFYALAWKEGRRETRCWLGPAPTVIAFWLLVLLLWWIRTRS